MTISESEAVSESEIEVWFMIEIEIEAVSESEIEVLLWLMTITMIMEMRTMRRFSKDIIPSLEKKLKGQTCTIIHILMYLGQRLIQPICSQEIIKEADVDMNGLIDYAEFFNLMIPKS